MGVLSSQVLVLAPWSDAVLFPFHFFDELAHADQGSTYGAASYFLYVVASGHAQGIKAAVKRLQHCMSFDASSNAAGGAMFDVDGCSDRDLVAFTIRLECMEGGGFHQPDHVRRRIDRRQFRMVRGEGVAELDRLLGLGARANGNFSRQMLDLCKKK